MKTFEETAVYIRGCSTFMKLEYIDEMIRISCFIYNVSEEEMNNAIDEAWE
jgi:hypothetical protein